MCLISPFLTGGSRGSIGHINEFPQADLRVPHDGCLERVVSPELLGVDIELDDRRPYLWEFPVIGHLATGLAPNKKNQVGIKHRLVCGFAGINAYDTHVERVVGQNSVFGVEGCSNGDLKFLSKFHQLRPRPRMANAASRNDDGLLRRRQEPCRLLYTPRLGLWPVSGHSGGGLVHKNLEVSFRVVGQLPPLPFEFQMDGSRSPCCGDPKGLSKQVRVPFNMLHPDVEFSDRVEHGEVFDFLVDIAIVGLRIASPRNGDHRRAPEIGVPEARSEIGRSHRLGHAYPGAATGSRVAIGHIYR